MPPKSRSDSEDREEAIAKVLIEATLFLSDRPVSIHRLRNITGVKSLKIVEKILATLKAEYEEGGRAFTITKFKGDRYMMHVKPQWLGLVKRHVGKTVLGQGVLRTLAFIAFHQPVEKSTVALMRGSRAYSQIRELVERGLVEDEKKGRSSVLRTSKLFAELFGVEDSPTAIRRKIEELTMMKEKTQDSP
jgi:segregation and condensation protein B